MKNAKRYKHLRGRHDQRDHNRWPAGYQAQTPPLAGGGGGTPVSNIPSQPPDSPPPTRRGDLMTARAQVPVPAGGLARMTQELVLANRMPWQQGVPNNAFAKMVQQRGKNPAYIAQAIQEVTAQKDRVRFNPMWSLRAYKKARKQRQGVSKIKLDANSPYAMGIPGNSSVDYLWNQRPPTNNISAENSWIAFDSYVMPLVADALTTALGMHESSASSVIRGETVVDAAPKGMPLNMTDPRVVQDMASGKINIEDQALVDLLVGRANTSDTDYVIVQTPEGYAVRSSNYNNSGQNTTERRVVSTEDTFGTVNKSNQFLAKFMINNQMNGSNTNTEINPNPPHRINDEIRFSPETLHKLASAIYAIQYDPKIPDVVKEQMRERMQYVLGNAYHLGKGVRPSEMDLVSAEQKESPFGLVGQSDSDEKRSFYNTNRTASATVQSYTELTEQPHRGVYDKLFPEAYEIFKNFAEQSSGEVDQIQTDYRRYMQARASRPMSQMSQDTDEPVLDRITDLSTPMASMRELYDNILRFSALNEEFSSIASMISSQGNSALVKRMNTARMNQLNMFKQLKNYLQNPNLTGFGIMDQRTIRQEMDDLFVVFRNLERDSMRLGER